MTEEFVLLEHASTAPSVRRRLCSCALAAVALGSFGMPVHAGGGPLGIDHRLPYDDHGIWSRPTQELVLDALIAGEIGGALWEGGESRVGRTLWESIDASGAGELSSELLKRVFSRVRPIDANDPDLWFQGSPNESFPSGEVTAVTSIITPFVLEYRKDRPAVYALELLPVYDAVARMKVQAHWQTDVIAGFALGTTWGYLAHRRNTPFVLEMLPQGFMVGVSKRF